MVSGDLDRVEAVAPGIAAFVRRRGRAWTAFNPRGGCWFLAQDGLCNLEREHGRDHKPAACRLFPFNRVFVAGDWRVIDFNSVICPLEVAENGVRHEDVLAEIDTIQDPAVVGSPLPEGAAELIAIEARASPGYDEAPGVVAVFGESRTPRAETRAHADALLRSLRFNELFGPRRWAPRPTLQNLLGRMSSVWLHLLAVGEELAERPLTLQEATSIWGETVGLSYLLARWKEPAWIAVDNLEVPDSDDVLAIARELRRNQRKRAPLGTLLEARWRARPLRDRIVAARDLETLFPSLRFGAKRRR